MGRHFMHACTHAGTEGQRSSTPEEVLGVAGLAPGGRLHVGELQAFANLGVPRTEWDEVSLGRHSEPLALDGSRPPCLHLAVGL